MHRDAASLQMALGALTIIPKLLSTYNTQKRLIERLPISLFLYIVKYAIFFFQCIFSLLMLTTSNVFDLINYFSQTLWLSVGASVVGMLWLRRARPDLPRPIKVNIIIPYLFLLAIGCLVIIPAITQPKDTAIGLAILLSGIPVYYMCVKWQNKPDCYHKFSAGILRFLQKLCSCIYVDSIEKLSN